MAADVRQRLDEWLRPLVNQEPEEIRQALKARWADLQCPCLVRLRELLVSAFRPTSIVVHKDESWLCVSRPFPGVPDARDTMLIPAPVSHTALAPMLAKFPAADNPPMVEFLTNFGALRELLPPDAGHWCVPEAWETLYDYWGNEDDIPGGYGTWYQQWSQALVIFHSPSGDLWLLHPSGNVAVSLMAEGELWPAGDNCEAFLDRYVTHRQNHGLLDGAAFIGM
jgi:hypothetical protein